MWRIYYGSELLYDPRDPALSIVDMSGENALNEAGEFAFTMPPTHPLAGKVKCVQKDAEIVVEQNGAVVWAGRAMESESDFDGCVTYECEGERGYLNDVTLPPYSTTDPDVPSTVDGLFNWYIAQYNEKVEPRHRMVVGVNEGALLDPNNHVLRESSGRPTVWAEIKEKLLEKLGGYIRMRREGGIRYIDYLADGGKACAQRIEFGVNMLDYMRRLDPSDFCTKVIPIGAETEDGGNVDISSLPDGPLQQGFEKVGDGIVSVDGAAEYGIIERVVEFDGITLPENLLQAGLRNAVNRKFGDTLEIDAIDLHQLDPSVERIELGSYVRATSKPHGVDEYFLCARVPFAPGEPGGASYTLGSTYDTITGRQSARIAALNASINKAYEAVAPIGAEAKEAARLAAEAAAIADGKSTITPSTETPSTPFKPGDIWIDPLTKDILTAQVEKGADEVYEEGDYTKEVPYTDDATAIEAKKDAELAISAADDAKSVAEGARDAADSVARRVREEADGLHVGLDDGSGSEVVVGNDRIEIRDAGGKAVSSWLDSEIRLGAWSDSAKIGDTSRLKFYGGSGSLAFTVGGTRDSMEMTSGDVRLSASNSGLILSSGSVELTGDLSVNSAPQRWRVNSGTVETPYGEINWEVHSDMSIVMRGRLIDTQAFSWGSGLGMYESSKGAPRFDFPFELAEPPMEFVELHALKTMSPTGEPLGMMKETYYPATAKQSGEYYAVRGNAGPSSAYFVIDYLIIGRVSPGSV